MVSIRFLTYSTTTEQDSSTSTTFVELPRSWVRLWILLNWKKCYKELLLMVGKSHGKISTISWLKRHSDWFLTWFIFSIWLMNRIIFVFGVDDMLFFIVLDCIHVCMYEKLMFHFACVDFSKKNQSITCKWILNI